MSRFVDISVTFVETDDGLRAMQATQFHREDIKALLRKRYGSVEAFQEACGLDGQQVRDLLRGKSNKARAAVAHELGVDPDQLVITSEEVPVCGKHSNTHAAAHRLSGAAK